MGELLKKRQTQAHMNPNRIEDIKRRLKIWGMFMDPNRKLSISTLAEVNRMKLELEFLEAKERNEQTDTLTTN